MTPLIQKMQRVPFSLKDKVTAKINELLEQDIIERVEDPTTLLAQSRSYQSHQGTFAYVLT